MSLAGKVALITGGSRGIGAGITRRLAADGAGVAVCYRERAAQAEALAAELRGAGRAALAVRLDAADPASVTSAFAAVLERFGRLDILVNNAGVVGPRGLSEIDETHLQELLQVNLAGPVRVAVAAARILADGGRIIQISSVNGHIPSPGASVYAASKAGLDSLTRSWAHELAPRGITVNAVAPGWTESEMLDVAVPTELRPHAVAMTAMGRIGTPADIAEVVAFLASDAARWVTGQIVTADGGIRAW